MRNYYSTIISILYILCLQFLQKTENKYKKNCLYVPYLRFKKKKNLLINYFSLIEKKNKIKNKLLTFVFRFHIHIYL